MKTTLISVAALLMASSASDFEAEFKIIAR